jgi:PAS domain S-box-containing protein
MKKMCSMIKILAIDDNQDNLITLKALINDAFPNAVVYAELSGMKGIGSARFYDPDVILLDILMPEMDGFDVCKKIKADKVTADIPVVFLTALKGDKESRIRALECGGEAFLTKPIDVSELTAQIRAMVKIKRAKIEKRDENERLNNLVTERTQQLERELEERRKAEIALKNSEGQLRGIFENLQDAYFRANLNGLFTMVSPSAIKMYGFSSADELIGKPAELLYADPKDRAEMISALKNEGRIEDLTLKARKKDGSTIWVSMNVQLVKDPDGKIIGTEGVVRDINERVAAERLLRESEEQFKHVFEAANVGKSITLPTGEININQGFCDMLGYSREELRHKKWQDITPFDDIQPTQELIAPLLRGEKNDARFTKRYIHKNGTFVWVDVSVAMLRDQQNTPLHFITTVIDITDQVMAKAALRKSEETARALLNGIPESAFLMELDGTVIAANITVAQRLNTKLDDLVGVNMYKLVDPEVAERRRRYQEQVVTTKQPVQFEDERFGRTIDNRIHPILDQLGNVTQLAIIGIDITERKLAEERLRESEMRSRSTFDQSPVGSVIVGLDKRFIKANAAFCKFSGYSEEELIGKSISDITHPEDVEIGMTELKSLLQGSDGSLIVQKRYLRKDGTIVWGEVSISLGRDVENKPLCFLPIIQDITERKQAEKQITLLNRAIEQSTVSVVITNKEGIIEYTNPKVRELTGYTAEELMGKNPRIFNSGEQPVEFYEELWKTILSGNNWKGEFHNKKKNGELYWESATLSPITNRRGEIINFVAIKEDITERKTIIRELVTAKEKAEKSEDQILQQKQQIELDNNRLEGLLRISQFDTNSTQELLDFALEEAINLTNSKIGYIYFYNENTQEFILNTWSKEVMSECAVNEPQSVYNLDKTGCWGEAVRQRKPIIINDYKAYNPLKRGTPEGHVQLEKFLTIPVIFDSKIVAVAGVANKTDDYNDSDIRQLTLLMDNVWKISERLFLIEDLRKAKEKAEESDRLKSSFLANMSHEIRTPMNSIMGFASLLPEEESKELIANYASIIVRNSEQLVHVIDDIVLYSRLQTKLLKNIPIKFNARDLLFEVKQSFNLPDFHKGVELLIDTDTNEALWIKSDYEKLNQVFTNLITNAFKYTPSGTITIGIINDDNQLKFFVKDTGMGIPASEKERIFDRFYRASNVNKGAIGGTGLGLSIVKELIDLLGGKVWVESQEANTVEGKAGGSTFYFTIGEN